MVLACCPGMQQSWKKDGTWRFKDIIAETHGSLVGPEPLAVLS